jgi:acetyltransferase-like isoleucine patch superfamily enzyme
MAIFTKNNGKGLIGRALRYLELAKYNSKTISEYFRQQGAQIGEGCIILPKFLGTEPYLIKLGNRVSIANGVTFITHDGGAAILRDKVTDLQVFGPIVVGDNCVIGQNVTIFCNVHIGANSIIGANSVVISNIPPNTIAMGVPARPFGSVEKYREKCQERWEAQRPPDLVLGPGENWWDSVHFDENRAKLRRHLLNLFSAELSVPTNDASPRTKNDDR